MGDGPRGFPARPVVRAGGHLFPGIDVAPSGYYRGAETIPSTHPEERMPSHARFIGGALALSLGVVACKGVGGTAADTSLARDLQLAARGAGQQQLKDAPDATGRIGVIASA